MDLVVSVFGIGGFEKRLVKLVPFVSKEQSYTVFVDAGEFEHLVSIFTFREFLAKNQQ